MLNKLALELKEMRASWKLDKCIQKQMLLALYDSLTDVWQFFNFFFLFRNFIFIVGKKELPLIKKKLDIFSEIYNVDLIIYYIIRNTYYFLKQ